VKAGGGAPSLNLIVYWGGTPQKHRCIQNKYNTIQYNTMWLLPIFATISFSDYTRLVFIRVEIFDHQHEHFSLNSKIEFIASILGQSEHRMYSPRGAILYNGTVGQPILCSAPTVIRIYKKLFRSQQQGSPFWAVWPCYTRLSLNPHSMVISNYANGVTPLVPPPVYTLPISLFQAKK